MPLPTPIVLTLYDPETGDKLKDLTRTFVPWKLLKKGVTLQKAFGGKTPEQYEESDIDALTAYVIAVFPKSGLTVEILDEQSDIAEMMTVIRAIVSRAKGIMDPTLPPGRS